MDLVERYNKKYPYNYQVISASKTLENYYLTSAGYVYIREELQSKWTAGYIPKNGIKCKMRYRINDFTCFMEQEDGRLFVIDEKGLMKLE